jgi:hypothetical protein
MHVFAQKRSAAREAHWMERAVCGQGNEPGGIAAQLRGKVGRLTSV